MAFLKDFSREERDLLVSLPYRVGLWVSTSDHTGGSEADSQELLALEKTITKLAQGMFESAFVHEVMADTFLRKDDWANWGGELGNVTAECIRAVTVMQGRLAARDIDAYRHMLMQIGLEVARAFREYDGDQPIMHRITRWIGIGVDRFFGIIRGEKYVSADLLNISYEEDLALNELAKALRGEVNDLAEGAQMMTNS